MDIDTNQAHQYEYYRGVLQTTVPTLYQSNRDTIDLCIEELARDLAHNQAQFPRPTPYELCYMVGAMIAQQIANQTPYHTHHNLGVKLLELAAANHVGIAYKTLGWVCEMDSQCFRAIQYYEQAQAHGIAVLECIASVYEDTGDWYNALRYGHAHYLSTGNIRCLDGLFGTFFAVCRRRQDYHLLFDTAIHYQPHTTRYVDQYMDHIYGDYEIELKLLDHYRGTVRVSGLAQRMFDEKRHMFVRMMRRRGMPTELIGMICAY
jgi:hypothetical protein